MKINFKYDKEKDVWCLLNKGKSSNNSSKPTAVYQELVSKAGDNPDEVATSLFIDEYLKANNLQPETFIQSYQEIFGGISADFQAVAERVFGVSLNKDITAYLTINSRCPYSIEEGWFFVSMSKGHPSLTMMHELWHFYTWEKFGAEWMAKLGKEKYNDIKEALTVLLNIECRHLLPEGSEDNGYPQHQKIRSKIIQFWEKDKNMDNLWNHLAEVEINPLA